MILKTIILKKNFTIFIFLINIKYVLKNARFSCHVFQILMHEAITN